MPAALVVYADGTEDLEVTSVTDVLTRGGIKVTKAAVRADGACEVTLSHGTRVICDQNISDCRGSTYDVIVVPGGLPGAETCGSCPVLRDLLLEQHQAGRLTAAICAAPGFVLARHGIISDKVEATGYPGCADNIVKYNPAGVVFDEAANVITGKGPAFALAFAFKILECVQGPETAAQVKKGMLYTD